MKGKWFEVDRDGLARIAARRNKRFILRELVQNAWDEDTTRVKVEIERPDGARGAVVRVIDDAPDGFKNLTHAYTLFAQSAKVTDATKRGRFNFGEKLVLAISRKAKITTTTGTVIFDDGEKRGWSNRRTDVGTIFEALIPMTAAEREELIEDARRMIPPDGKTTTINGEPLEPRVPVATFEHMLSTEVAGDDGMLRHTYRTATLRVYEVRDGETAHLYEMGIPVVETGDRWHVDVGQKIPLNMERDNVSPSYLRDVRVAVANATRDLLTTADANATWGRNALEDYQCKPETARRLIALRFGDRAVTYDPSDVEANSIAVAKGYTVVHGSQLSADEWARVRESNAMLPAGQVTPSPKPFTPGGRELRTMDRDDWSTAMADWAAFAEDLALSVAGATLRVVIADDRGWAFNGCIGGGILHVNRAKVGDGFFETPRGERSLRFLIHEFGHTVASNHLSDAYHEALCTIGAKVAVYLNGGER